MYVGEGGEGVRIGETTVVASYGGGIEGDGAVASKGDRVICRAVERKRKTKRITKTPAKSIEISKMSRSIAAS